MKVEFIESYWTGGELGSDYQWSDNHGELIRCRNCVFSEQIISRKRTLGSARSIMKRILMMITAQKQKRRGDTDGDG